MIRRSLTIPLLVLGLLGLVGPVTAASAKPAPTPPNDHTIKVVSTRMWRDDNTITIVADLKNTTKKWRKKVRGVVSFYNRKGKRLANDVAYPEQTSAAPRGHLSLKFYDVRTPRGFHHYRLTFTSKVLKKKPVGHLKIKVGEVAIDPDIGGLNVPVTVRNRNKFRVRHVAVVVTLFNKKGKVLNVFNGYNYTDPSVLAPGQAGSITVYFGSHFAGVRTVNVMAEAGR